MKVYTAALIDKPLRSLNEDLRKNLASDLLNQSQKDKINEIFAEEIQQFRY